MHAESAYAFLPYDRSKVTSLIAACIDGSDDHFGLVAETDGEVVAMIAGYLCAYFFCDEKLACDIVVFVDSDRRGGIGAARLIRGFRDWAVERGARELCLGISTGVAIETTGALYERLGLTRVGGVFKQRLDTVDG